MRPRRRTEKKSATMNAGSTDDALALYWRVAAHLAGTDEEVRRAPDPVAAAEMALIRLAYAADLPGPEEALKAQGVHVHAEGRPGLPHSIDQRGLELGAGHQAGQPVLLAHLGQLGMGVEQARLQPLAAARQPPGLPHPMHLKAGFARFVRAPCQWRCRWRR